MAHFLKLYCYQVQAHHGNKITELSQHSRPPVQQGPLCCWVRHGQHQASPQGKKGLHAFLLLPRLPAPERPALPEVPELQATRTWWASPCIVQGLNTVSRSWACTPRSRQHGLQGQGPLLLLQELAAALQAHSVRPTPTMPTTPGGAHTPACRHGRAKGDQAAEEVDQAAEEVTVQPFFRFVVAEPTAPQTRAGWGT